MTGTTKYRTNCTSLEYVNGVILTPPLILISRFQIF